MFYDMAAVYWRAVGAPQRVAECYGRAFHSVPDAYKDVVYVGMAGFFRFMNDSESSLFLMGEIADTNTKEVCGGVFSCSGESSLCNFEFFIKLYQKKDFE